jgi:virginiamycin B lyase
MARLITDGGLNAIVRVDHGRAVKAYWLPVSAADANLTTAFDRAGRLWFTGRAVLRKTDPATGRMQVRRALGDWPLRHHGPRGACHYAPLAGSHIARIDVRTGRRRESTRRRQTRGAPGVVGLTRARLGQRVERRPARDDDPATRRWREWKLPAQLRRRMPSTSTTGVVWVTDWG